MKDEPNKKQPESLGTKSVKHTVRGKLNQATGKVQRKAGELTGNKKMKSKGTVREIKGKVQSKLGEIERKIDDMLKP